MQARLKFVSSALAPLLSVSGTLFPTKIKIIHLLSGGNTLFELHKNIFCFSDVTHS